PGVRRARPRRLSRRRGSVDFHAMTAKLAGMPATAEPPARPRWWWFSLRRLVRPIALPVGFAAVILALWEFLIDVYRVPPVLLPAPSAIFAVLWRNLGQFIEHAQSTGLACAAAFISGTALGILAALVITYSAVVREMLYPNILIFQFIPKVALAPLFVVWFGIGGGARLGFAIFVSFFPVMISTSAGLVSVDRQVIRLCEALTATRGQIFLHVRLPYAIPYIFSGMKIGVTMAMIGVIVGEFITAQEGLGYLILFATSRVETAIVFASIAVLCGIGLVMYGVVLLLEGLIKRVYST
ncbi:MAG: ABC transporter permease, partial [Roseiarcus sp.]